jgi:hypothetical protein
VNNNDTSTSERLLPRRKAEIPMSQEIDSQCSRIRERCQQIELFAFNENYVLGCEDVLEHGTICLYVRVFAETNGTDNV